MFHPYSPGAAWRNKLNPLLSYYIYYYYEKVKTLRHRQYRFAMTHCAPFPRQLLQLKQAFAQASLSPSNGENHTPWIHAGVKSISSSLSTSGATTRVENVYFLIGGG